MGKARDEATISFPFFFFFFLFSFPLPFPPPIVLVLITASWRRPQRCLSAPLGLGGEPNTRVFHVLPFSPLLFSPPPPPRFSVAYRVRHTQPRRSSLSRTTHPTCRIPPFLPPRSGSRGSSRWKTADGKRGSFFTFFSFFFFSRPLHDATYLEDLNRAGQSW